MNTIHVKSIASVMSKIAAISFFSGSLILSQISHAHNDSAYSHDYRAVAANPSWMAGVDGSKRVSELSIPGTHDTMSIRAGDAWQNQTKP